MAMLKWFCVSVMIAMVLSVEKKHMIVYYDALDKDSADFIVDQLYPVFRSHLYQTLAIELVPFGLTLTSRTSDDKTWKFTCVKGEVNCYANKVHACILKKVLFFEHQMQYVNCLMKGVKEERFTNTYPLLGCLGGTDLVYVEQCLNSTEADEALAEFKTETMRLDTPIRSTPTITFDRHFNSTANSWAKRDLVRSVCWSLDMDNPGECVNLGPPQSNFAEIHLPPSLVLCSVFSFSLISVL